MEQLSVSVTNSADAFKYGEEILEDFASRNVMEKHGTKKMKVFNQNYYTLTAVDLRENLKIRLKRVVLDSQPAYGHTVSSFSLLFDLLLSRPLLFRFLFLCFFPSFLYNLYVSSFSLVSLVLLVFLVLKRKKKKKDGHTWSSSRLRSVQLIVAPQSLRRTRDCSGKTQYGIADRRTSEEIGQRPSNANI